MRRKSKGRKARHEELIDETEYFCGLCDEMEKPLEPGKTYETGILRGNGVESQIKYEK